MKNLHNTHKNHDFGGGNRCMLFCTYSYIQLKLKCTDRKFNKLKTKNKREKYREGEREREEGDETSI